MKSDVKDFMAQNGYSGHVNEFCSIRKDYKNRSGWAFKGLEDVLKEFRLFLIKNKKI